MVENQNQHRQIAGYRELTQAEIDMKNAIANTEAIVAQVWAQVKNAVTHNVLVAGQEKVRPGELHESMRQHALARTHFEQAFMHLSRSLLRPGSPWMTEGEPQPNRVQAGGQVGGIANIPVSRFGETLR